MASAVAAACACAAAGGTSWEAMEADTGALILSRIGRGVLEEAVRRLDSPRWYVAWTPDHPEAFLRKKTLRGFEEWRDRTWKDLPAPPLILDVTHDIGTLFAGVVVQGPESRAAGWRAHGPEVANRKAVLTLRTSGPGLALREPDATADGEVADISRTFWEMLNEEFRTGPMRTWTRGGSDPELQVLFFAKHLFLYLEERQIPAPEHLAEFLKGDDFNRRIARGDWPGP